MSDVRVIRLNPQGPAGPPGVIWGLGAPEAGLGINGQIYLDLTTNAEAIYGPKASGAWGTGRPLGGGSGGGLTPQTKTNVSFTAHAGSRYFVFAATTPVTITIEDAALMANGNTDIEIYFADATNKITVVGTSGQTFAGYTTLDVETSDSCLQICTNGLNWYGKLSFR